MPEETVVCNSCGVVIAASRVKFPEKPIEVKLGPKGKEKVFGQYDAICPICGKLCARTLEHNGKKTKVTPNLDLSKAPDGIPA